MEFLGTVIKLLDTQIECPKPYGILHLSFFIISIIAGIWLCLAFKNPNERTVKKIILIITLSVIALEIYKQFNYTFTYSDGKINAAYRWFIFPFQFCSMPMYVGLIASLSKKWLHKAATAFLATYSMFAGICVMIYPNDILTTTLGINIQSLICHGSMISIGIFLLGSGYVKHEHKTMLYAVPVFSTAVGIAMILNEVAVATKIIGDQTFNMFFINPHFPPSLPVYSIVQEYVPFPFCVIIYILAFSLASYVILLLAMAIGKIVSKEKAKKIKV